METVQCTLQVYQDEAGDWVVGLKGASGRRVRFESSDEAAQWLEDMFPIVAIYPVKLSPLVLETQEFSEQLQVLQILFGCYNLR